MPADQLYNEAMEQLEKKKYKKSIESFETLERTYPYSKWAVKAQVMSAYASYNAEEYTDAINTIDKFISLYPANPDTEYVYYLKAMCYYEQMSDINRDQGMSILASSALKELVGRFPDGKYAKDAKGKLDLVQDYLAGKEVSIGRFYLKKGKYIAAINRFTEVTSNYQTTTQVPEALHRLVEANLALGLKEEAYKYAAVLGYNYPGSKWYGYSYKLLEGKKLKVDASEGEDSIIKQWLDKAEAPFKNSLNKLKKQPNLTNDVESTVHEIGPDDVKKAKENEAEKPNAEPVVREVKIKEIEEEEQEDKDSASNLNWLKKWFKW